MNRQNRSRNKSKWRQENQRYKQRDNRCEHCGVPKWTRQHMCPAKMAKSRNCKGRGHYEKMCRSTKGVQYIEKTTSSAEDNWDYNRIQRINDNKQKKIFYNATQLVNNVPIKFIIENGSPVTLIPECLFTDITTIKPLKTTYEDVNNQRNEFTGQTNALVETNKAIQSHNIKLDNTDKKIIKL